MNLSDEQQAIHQEIKIKPQVPSGSNEQSWYARTLSAMRAMIYGAPKIHLTNNIADIPDQGLLNLVQLPNSYQLNSYSYDRRSFNVDEYFNQAQDGKILYPELTKFIQIYSCDDEVTEQGLLLMEERDNRFSARKFYKGKDFFIKGKAVDRLINARRMKNYFEKYHLDHLDVADKCLLLTQSSLYALSKKVEHGDQTKQISIEEAEQLIRFTLGTGYWDWSFGLNVIRSVDDKLVFIDTEDAAFDYELIVINGDNLTNKKFLLNSLYLDLKEAHYDEAAQFVFNRYDRIKDTDEGRTNVLLLSRNSEYDDPGIDFEQVKKEFKEFEASKK